MILKTKYEILNWLEQYDRDYKKNIKKNAYQFIDIHDHINQALLNEMMHKDNLLNDYFENLKKEGHRYIINVKDSSNLYNKKLIEIPFQFYHINGTFNCSDNQIISLKGCPQYVGGSFDYSYNQLSSLDYCPRIVGGHFYCDHNQLNSLKFCPQSIGDHFDCSHNQLTSLEYCPQIVGGDFYCHHNQLISLEYFPEKNGDIYLDHNQELLKYQKESNDIHIQNMFNDDFLNQRDFKFWQQFYLKEKNKKENS